jgi:hypothetical protein
MAITLLLKPETEAQLIARATAKGVPVEQYLKSWIETNLVTEVDQPFHQTATAAEWVDAFTNWANSRSNNAPPLSDEAISRESIYREREDRQL